MFHGVEKVAQSRLDLYELVAHHPDATFFVSYKGDDLDEYSIYKNDVLVIDRSVEAKVGTIIVAQQDNDFTIMRYDAQVHSETVLWGVVSYVIHSLV
jgi:DNA polymerase V